MLPKKRLSLVERGAFRAKHAAAYVSLSTATFARLRAAGRLPVPVKLGGCLLWPKATLDKWLSAGCPDAETFQRLNAERN